MIGLDRVAALPAGDLSRSGGLHDKAESLYTEALNMAQQALGPEHAICATSLNSLALLYSRQGHHEKAENYCSEALAISRRAFGAGHVNTATSLNNLASLYSRRDLHEKARWLYLRSLAITRKAVGSNHQEMATILNNLALNRHNQGAYEVAERLYKQSLQITNDTLGSDHRDRVVSLNNLAHLYYKQGSYSQAEALFQEGLKLQFVLLQKEAPFLPKTDRLSFLRSFGLSNEAFCSYATTSLQTARLALFALVNCQGLLERIEGLQARLAIALRGVNLEEEQELRTLVQRLASKAILPEQRLALKARQEELERQLYRILPELRPRVVEMEEVASALPANSALVVFQRFQPFDESKSGGRCWGEARYLALILKPDGSVAAVDMGGAGALETAIKEARSNTIQCFADSSSPWETISSLLLSPLLPHLSNETLWFLSLDGELSRIPMHVLPLPNQPDQWLVEAVKLRLVSSGRDLLDQPSSREHTPPAGAALVVADPAFDRDPTATSSDEPDSYNHPFRSRDLELVRFWEPLPGTAKEGQEVAEILGAKLLTGGDATTLAVQEAKRPRILHIATHGFFLPDQPEQLQAQPWLSFDRPDVLERFSGEDPMLRSGLVLAGANHQGSDPDEDDGYLTAMEAVHLNLQDTELVTLSACDSGSGDIRTGEGVYGLQRAFIVAGARSLLISLWPVPDEATCAFMVRFYSLLKDGLGRDEALIAVQREFREHENIVWRHPYYWGAWQLIGDGSPIEGL